MISFGILENYDHPNDERQQIAVLSTAIIGNNELFYYGQFLKKSNTTLLTFYAARFNKTNELKFLNVTDETRKFGTKNDIALTFVSGVPKVQVHLQFYKYTVV